MGWSGNVRRPPLRTGRPPCSERAPSRSPAKARPREPSVGPPVNVPIPPLITNSITRGVSQQSGQEGSGKAAVSRTLKTNDHPSLHAWRQSAVAGFVKRFPGAAQGAVRHHRAGDMRRVRRRRGDCRGSVMQVHAVVIPQTGPSGGPNQEERRRGVPCFYAETSVKASGSCIRPDLFVILPIAPRKADCQGRNRHGAESLRPTRRRPRRHARR